MSLNGWQKKVYYQMLVEQIGLHEWTSCGAASAPARAIFLNGYQEKRYYLMLNGANLAFEKNILMFLNG